MWERALLANGKNHRTQGVLLQLKKIPLDNPGLSQRLNPPKLSRLLIERACSGLLDS
jgi:hypothetical protein